MVGILQSPLAHAEMSGMSRDIAPSVDGSTSVWTDLLAAYNRARLYIAVAATISGIVVGTINGWPRGPAVVIGSAGIALHSAVLRRRQLRPAYELLAVDAVVIAASTFAIGLLSVSLLSLGFLLVAAGILEHGRRMITLWVMDVVLIAGAHLISNLTLQDYSPTQADLTERVGIVFFAGATVALATGLSNRLRRSDAERRAVHEAIASRERRYVSLLARSSDGIAMVDEDLKITHLGVQNEELTGYGPADRIGASLLDLVVEDDRPKVIQAHQLARTDPTGVTRFQARIRRRDGEVRVMDGVITNGTDNPDLRGYVLNFHDVTDESKARAELEAANRKLEDLIRSKDEFVASVSHELRTPLTAVVGMAELISDSARDFSDDELGEFQTILVGQARQTAAIVEDLLVAARADIGQVTIRAIPCNVRQTIDTVVKMSNRPTEVVVNASNDLTACADLVRFQQIIRNLLSNAERHGGSQIWVHVARDAETIRIRVEDDGPGVPEDLSERIFEPYQRAYESLTLPSSIGLGLSVSRILARLMGGDLIYRREEPRTIFELTLPAVDVVAAAI